jgi:hypothetical protein
MKLKPVKADGEIYGYSFFCPGCEHSHVFFVKGSKTWSFNNDFEAPTFSPSLLNTCPDHPDSRQRRCHLNLIAGILVFAGDCSHPFAGKQVVLTDHDPLPRDHSA